MELKELISLLKMTTADGAKNALSMTGSLPEQLSKSKAYSRYGRSNVDRWLHEGLLKISIRRINRVKLEAIAAASNRATYLPEAERLG